MKIIDRKPSFDSTSPENPETAGKKHLLLLVRRGVPTNDCVGYHGTSMEAIEYLITHGSLPGVTHEHAKGLEIGEFYFIPRLDYFPKNHPFFRKYPSWKEPTSQSNTGDDKKLQNAAHYATNIAETHYFLRRLGIDFSADDYYLVARRLFHAIAYPFSPFSADRLTFLNRFEQMGYTRSELLTIIREARQRKGIILGIKHTVLSNFDIQPGNDEYNDVKIYIPEGLSFEFISGASPQSTPEQDFFSHLGARHSQ